MRSEEAHDDLRELPRTRDPNRAAGPLRARVLEALRSYSDFDVSGFPERTEDELAQMEEHLLFAWCDDTDGVDFVAVPESAITPALEEALGAVRSTEFVGAEDFDADGFAGLLRLMAAKESPARIAAGYIQQLQPWVEQETAGWTAEQRAKLPTRDELDALGAAFGQYLSMKPNALDRRYSRVVAIRKMS